MGELSRGITSVNCLGGLRRCFWVFVVVCSLLLLFFAVCCSLLIFVVVCCSSLLFVVTGNVTRTRASIIRRMGYITGTCTVAQGSSPDG